MSRLFPRSQDHPKTDACREYRVLCGIEEEFLLINKNGSLVQKADDVMLSAARILQQDTRRLRELRLRIRALDPEPSQAQIEYTTLPSPPTSTQDFVTEGRKLVSDASRAANCLALCQSIHPYESRPHPLAGIHINVSVRKGERLMTPNEELAVYNHCWNHLPELIAISANSPVIAGNSTGIASNRNAQSRVLRRNPFGTLQIPQKQSQLVQQSYYGRLRYSLKIGSDDTEPLVIMNPEGNRFTDISARGPYTNIDQDRDETPLRNRVEIRIFDVQTSSARLVDLCHLCCGLALNSMSYLQDNIDIEPDPYHDENVDRAIRNGLEATLLGPNGRIKASESVRELSIELTPYLDLMGVRFHTSLPSGKPEISQSSTPILTRKMQVFDELHREGRFYVMIEKGRKRTATDPRTGQRYQIPQGSRLFGTLQARHHMKLDEGEHGMISSFKEADPAYYLVVRGIPVLLDQEDKIEVAMTKNEYNRRRFFGFF